MNIEITEFMTEQKEMLAEQIKRIQKDPVKLARETAQKSAESLKGMKSPVRAAARSGVKLTAITQSTAQRLIELQTEIVTTALTDAAGRLERAARTDDVVDLLRDQAQALKATAERIVNDLTQTGEIFKDAGSDVLTVGTHLYDQVFESDEEEPPKAKAPRARKAKRAVRKSTARGRKAAA
jgi:phasin family protein